MTVFVGQPELLRRFQAGNREALSQVYWFYIERVELALRRGLRMAHGDWVVLGADDADLVQEVFLRAFAEPARLAYDAVRPYAPLLMTIARHTLADFLRRSGRERHFDPSQLAVLVENEPEEGAEGTEGPWTGPDDAGDRRALPREPAGARALGVRAALRP